MKTIYRIIITISLFIMYFTLLNFYFTFVYYSSIVIILIVTIIYLLIVLKKYLIFFYDKIIINKANQSANNKENLLLSTIIVSIMILTFIIITQIKKGNEYSSSIKQLGSFNYIAILNNIDLLDNIIISSCFVLFMCCIYILKFNQTKFSYESEENKKRINDSEKKQAFTITNYSEEDLKIIFDNLTENDFIIIIDNNTDKIDRDIFAEIMSKGVIPEKRMFNLNMDNLQTYYFFNKFSNKGFTLDILLKIFKNKNGNTTAQNISSSVSKASTNKPKLAEKIDECFNLKK